MSDIKKLLLSFAILITFFSNSYGLIDIDESYFADGNGRYLIVVHDLFYNSILPLAQWKHQKGMEVEVAKISEIGSTDSQIKGYIVNAYNLWTIPPEYILLVGDTEYLPMGYDAASDIYTDNFYADMNGDFKAELFVGRLSCDDVPQCETLISKNMGYEFPDIEINPNWFISATLLVADDYDDADITYYEDTQYAYDLMTAQGFTSIDTLFGKNWNDSQDVHESINAGTGFVNYRGVSGGLWCYPFDEINPYNFHNAFMLPVVVSATCASGDFMSADIFECERWVRAGTPENPKGAVAFFSTNTSGMSIHQIRSAVDRGFFGSVFEDQQQILGRACVDAKNHLVSVMPDEVTEYKGWNLLGDPELNIWTDIPQELSVDLPESVNNGTVEIYVTANGHPVTNALVSGIKDTEFYNYCYTNSQGIAQLTLTPETSSSVHITVTAPNCLAYENSIWVDVVNPDLGYESHEILDNNGGNGNGMLNPGETVEMNIILENFSDILAEGVTATLITESEFITLIDDQTSFGNISPAESEISQTPFTFSISPQCPNNYRAAFQLEISDVNGCIWISDIPLMEIYGAEVTFHGFEVDDITTGENGNCVLDPGEYAFLYFNFKNIGVVDLDNVELTLFSDDPYITIHDAQSQITTIYAGDATFQNETPFAVTLSDDLPIDYQIPVEIALSGDGETYQYETIFQPTLWANPTYILGWEWENDPRWISGIDWAGGTFFGSIGPGYNFFGSTIEPWQCMDVEIHFDSTDTTICAKYQRGFDFPYPYNGPGVFRGSAWDVSNPDNPRRLNICFVEWFESDIYNGVWDPDSSEVGGREYLFIMNSDYNEGVNYDDENWGPASDVIYAWWPWLRPNHVFLETDPAMLKIQSVSPTCIPHGAIDPSILPEKVTVKNYPNPFNPNTTIAFQIPNRSSKLVLQIYDVLGKLVKTLVDGEMETGYHSVVWDGIDEAGKMQESGIYIYQLTTGNHSQTGKMTLLK